MPPASFQPGYLLAAAVAGAGELVLELLVELVLELLVELGLELVVELLLEDDALEDEDELESELLEPSFLEEL
ncbi:hypothetical protein [Hyalangium versicolor]|uniref:hypothetical protein n=1 Tax=Hyalangium versicolor TaxID=2861190 RepID=UPI002729C936|nr:hypothetical protein [Hyalangium versicolor]